MCIYNKKIEANADKTIQENHISALKHQNENVFGDELKFGDEFVGTTAAANDGEQK